MFSDDAFADAVRDVAAGGTVLDPEVDLQAAGKRAAKSPLATLPASEREVL